MTKESEILLKGLGLSWITSWFLIIPISLIAIIISVYKLARLKSKLTKYAIILSPFLILPAVNISIGVIDYLNGNAKIKTHGYPSPEFANINQEFRVEHKAEGCSITGTEHLTSHRYNQTIKLLIKKFGYQKNSYLGVMPNKEEALELLTSSNVRKGSAKLTDEQEITINSDSLVCSVNLPPQHGLFKKTIIESKFNNKPNLALVDNCLVAELNTKWIYLIDINKDKIIAQYRI